MEARQTYLLNQLSNNDVTFYIPPYQRNYEWDRQQCEVFINDVLKTASRNLKGIRTEHFFGTIVYVMNDAIFGQPSKLVLTDGQQRITTTMLFLLAIRDVIEDKKIKEFIDKKYLKNENVEDDGEYKIKLKQVETDWEAYKNIVLGFTITDENKESAVYKNYNYFLTELKKLRVSATDYNIEDLISSGLDKFSIVSIQLEPQKNEWENPQEVFESMNSLGKPLSLADLVRNYLLLDKTSQEQEKLYNDYWLHMEKKLPDELSNFIRDYMQFVASKNYKKASISNYKELYAEFKILFKGKPVENLLKELRIFSDYYSYIVLGKDSGDTTINKQLEDMRTIGISIAHSFMMGIIHQWKVGKINSKETGEVLDVLLNFFIRRRILKLTQGENKTIPKFIKEINSLVQADDKRKYMFKILSKNEYALRFPNDKEVISGLLNMNFYKFSNAKYLLSIIEEKITKARPDKKSTTLQLEHIMPRTLTKAWQTELGEDYQQIHMELLDNIGNITLIRHNQELGNKGFSEKKETYKTNSGLQISRENIINRTKWNRNSVNHRAKWISDYLVNEVLTIPDSMKNKNNYIQKRAKLSFSELDLIGQQINYISDKTIVATVVSDNEVEFEDKIWRLSPLTREIEKRKGRANESGVYRGSQFWEYDELTLAEFVE